MQFCIQPKFWEGEDFWQATDIFSLSTLCFVPENYRATSMLYDNNLIYTLQGADYESGLESLTNGIRERLPYEQREEHHRQLTITYCQAMIALVKSKGGL